MKRPATLVTVEQLLQRDFIKRADTSALEAVAARYSVAITPLMADMIDASNDPIARQFIPQPEELETLPQERVDPIGDAAHSPVAGIVHRYPDRVLLKLVHSCPVYCRFCFRREMVGPNGIKTMSREERDVALDYIREQKGIWEVVLTGGDPFIASPRRLAEIINALSSMEHVKIVRFHTRVPVVAPERITPTLIDAIKAPNLTTFVVLHSNHANEMTSEAKTACATLVDAGIPMLSQSVLLRGINDTPEALGQLMRTLVENRIKPYYLHHGDLAPGTSHFRTTIAEGQQLMQHLHGRYSGLCQPQYVLDIPGGYGKSPIGPHYIQAEGQGDDDMRIRDYKGQVHLYPPVLDPENDSPAREASTGRGE